MKMKSISDLNLGFRDAENYKSKGNRDIFMMADRLLACQQSAELPDGLSGKLPT